MLAALTLQRRKGKSYIDRNSREGSGRGTWEAGSEVGRTIQKGNSTCPGMECDLLWRKDMDVCSLVA